MNGMNGRVLHIPGPSGGAREVLFIYGHHSSLERWWGIGKFLSRYAAVTIPDLPGFGGMDSFYKIGKKATLDNFADYLAAYIKLRYKKRKITVVGMSLGFVMITRMLQRCPELLGNVELLVSFAGFAHHDDFTFSRSRMLTYRSFAKLFTYRLPAVFFRYVCLHPYFLRTAYTKSHNAKEKFEGVVGEELEEIVNFEIELWHNNDVRTYMQTTSEFLRLDNCRQRVDTVVHHVGVRTDRYFDNDRVEQHFRVIFNDFVLLEMLELGNHAPSVVASEEDAKIFVPPKLRRILKSK